MPSNKAFSKGNQQERLELVGWIVGFVDGEGCFTISLHKNPTTFLGWQIMPEFILSQGEKSRKALEIAKDYFKCGSISINYRHDNHRENLYRYCVKSQKDLREIIVPFFQQHVLQTSKNKDFEIFSKVLDLMYEKKHLRLEGVKKIVSMIEEMNTRKKRQLILESSETIR